MPIIFAREPLPVSIFLAGPTPRDACTKSWRPEAIAELGRQGFDGTIFVPEDGDWSTQFTYDDQVEWELQALHSATCVLFWVPRDLSNMPAFTTNVEFGLFSSRRNVVLGSPETAVKNKYLEAIANLYNIPVFRTLDETCAAAIKVTQRPFVTS